MFFTLTLEIGLCICLPLVFWLAVANRSTMKMENKQTIAGMLAVLVFFWIALCGASDKTIDLPTCFGAAFLSLMVSGLGFLVREKWDKYYGGNKN
ncbi:MAG: hypothetical protein Q8M07_10700 [Prosthecobacter sp.]|nr:hypothetical protein [Prosthecobacter sp.]